MDVIETLGRLKEAAAKDPVLRKKLLKTAEEKSPLSAFCSISTEAGFPLYDMDLIDAGEEAYALMKRSTNGGGENSPRLDYQDDYYELFLAELRSIPGDEKNLLSKWEKKILRKGKQDSLKIAAYENEDGSELLLMESPMLNREKGIRHAFSTRIGGVSKGNFESMNLSFSRGDRREDVYENFRRIAAHFGVSEERFVLTYQTHTTNVRVVTEADLGKGVTRERDYIDVDALITDIPEVVLGVFWADCVPILMYDTVNHAIGVVHSGWRGTANHIAEKTIQKMKEVYGTNPENLSVVIGPSICKDCYEVSQDVADIFRDKFSGQEDEILRSNHKPGKYLLDLWKANEIILKRSGVKADHIETGDVCTCCNPEFIFSHRVQGEARGNNGAFLMLTNETT